MNRTTFARFSGLYAAYIGAAIVGRAFDDAFVATGLMPSDDWQDPVLLGAIAVTLVSFVWTLISSAGLLTILARYGLKATSRLTLFRTAELIIIETMRSIAAAMIRLPLLIIPGIIEWIRLSAVPFIVIFDREYQDNRVDALKTSRQFFSKHRALVFLLLLPNLAIFLLELVATASPQDSLPLWQAPIQHIGSILLFSGLRLIADTFVLSKYRSSVSNKA